MKKIFYTLIAASLAFTSCDSMLDEVNYGNPTVEDMMTSEENVVKLVGQIYANVKYTHDHWGYWGLVTITADEGVCIPRNGGNDWNDGGYWLKQNTHTWDHKGDAIKEVWNTTVNGAVLCNQIIKILNEYKESMSPEIYAQYLGEVEVMRCYYFYQLFDCFGRVPYTEKFEEATGPLYEPQDVWSQLVATLEKNAPNMAVVNDGNRSANYGRTTQGFAYTLLARLYLNAEGFGCTPENIFKKVEKPSQFSGSFYDNCVRCCDAVINSGSYSIEKDYFHNFALKNEDSKEAIFSIVENGLTDDEIDSGKVKNKLRIPYNTHHYGIQYYYGTVLDTWNGFCARPLFLEIFKSKTAKPIEKAEDWYDNKNFAGYYNSDLRGPGTELQGTSNTKNWGWFVGQVNKKGSTTELYLDEDVVDTENPKGTPTVIHVGVSSLFNAHNFDGARLNKWELDKTGTYKFCENDFHIFRYADVLWMKIEAVLRGGAGSVSSVTSLPDFHTLMARSFAYDPNPEQAYKDAYGDVNTWTLDDVLAERGREFSWEMVRRRDLIRYDKYHSIQYVTDPKAKEKVRKWFPIPYSVLEKSLIDETTGQKIWTQTPGYENL